MVLFGDHLCASFQCTSDMSLVAYGDSSSDSEIDEGDENLESGPPEEKKSDVRKLLGLLPPPKGSKSSKQPVRISLPAVKAGVRLFIHGIVLYSFCSLIPVFASPQNDSDDEDEGGPQAKRVKTVLHVPNLLCIHHSVILVMQSALLSHSLFPSLSLSFPSSIPPSLPPSLPLYVVGQWQ